MQEGIDRANTEFWNELCGSNLAKTIGIEDSSPESLAKFDQTYFELYPYLLDIVQLEKMSGKRTLEIGLGYGTLGQRIAESGADYVGLDLAEHPVDFMKYRLQLAELHGCAVQGSALDVPFPDEEFDFVVSIGCFHHTGNVQQCLDEAWRVLKPGGAVLFMVYNKYSLRQWRSWPRHTFQRLLADHGLAKVDALDSALEEHRKAYDANTAGISAPETVFLSIGDLKRMLPRFGPVEFRKRNCDDLYVRNKWLCTRRRLLPILGPVAGLDIYCRATKSLETSEIPCVA